MLVKLIKMRNFKKNNRRRFRSNSFDRNLKIGNNDQSFNSNLGNISDFKKKNYNRNNFNASKLIQKYSDLAREALSSGDKILYESYMQQVEHFVRISENYPNNTNKSNNSENLEDTNFTRINETEKKTQEIIQSDKS